MLSVEDVKKVAKLAKFKLSEEEELKFKKLLSEALDYVEVLSELDVVKVSPTSQVTGLTNVWQDDVPVASLSVEEVLKNAPRKDSDYFVTDVVINKGSSS